MRQYIPIICFIAGVITGALALYFGFVLGFRASYEIRNGKLNQADDENKGGLFGPAKKDPAEFELLDDKDNKKNE